MNPTDGLNTFQLKPEGLSGTDLFEHMNNFRSIHNNKYLPSFYLYIDVEETQQSVIYPTEVELTKGRIMRDTVGLNASLKMAKRKLCNLGYIKPHCGIQNSDDMMKKLKTQLQLASSIAEINAEKDNDKVMKVKKT